MPQLDLSTAQGLRVAGQDVSEVRIANQTVWEVSLPLVSGWSGVLRFYPPNRIAATTITRTGGNVIVPIYYNNYNPENTGLALSVDGAIPTAYRPAAAKWANPVESPSVFSGLLRLVVGTNGNIRLFDFSLIEKQLSNGSVISIPEITW